MWRRIFSISREFAFVLKSFLLTFKQFMLMPINLLSICREFIFVSRSILSTFIQFILVSTSLLVACRYFILLLRNNVQISLMHPKRKLMILNLNDHQRLKLALDL